MPRVSPSQAKNFMARSRRALIDPHPSGTALHSLWKHFNHCCAYCGIKLQLGTKQAHYDHLVAKDGNHLGNFVLACARCNEHEKREMNWETFLRQKATTTHEYKTRHARIIAWRDFHSRNRSPVSPTLLECAEKSIRCVIRAYDRELIKLRVARQAQRRSTPQQ